MFGKIPEWITYPLTFITGGAIWEFIKFILPDIKHYIKSRRDAKKELYTHIDPILKSADELYGKISSLAKEDFATFANVSHSISENVEHNRKYIYYLFAQLWAHLEFIRIKSQYSSIARIKRGKELIVFIDTLEAREFRILDRSLQRMIGEGLIENAKSTFKIMTLNQFILSLNSPTSPNNIFIKQLEDKLLLSSDKTVRQKILVYGVIIDRLINHFDPDNKIVRNRKIYSNKLNAKSKTVIRLKLFKHYLPFAERTKLN